MKLNANAKNWCVEKGLTEYLCSCFQGQIIVFMSKIKTGSKNNNLVFLLLLWTIYKTQELEVLSHIYRIIHEVFM